MNREQKQKEQDAQAEIVSLLDKIGVTMTAQHVPTVYDHKKAVSASGGTDENWPHIAWSCKFTSPRGSFTADYRQGLGHLPKSIQYPPRTVCDVDIVRVALESGTVPVLRHGHAVPQKSSPLPAPERLDVIYCLMSDAEAAQYESFEQWAAELEYDADSRKAEKIFIQCRNVALDLNRVFGAAVVERLRELYQAANY
jgi:hypothetical protein